MKHIWKHCRWLPERDTAKCEIRNWSAGEQKGRALWTIKATKKNAHLLIQRGISCFYSFLALVSFLQVSPFSALFNRRINNLLLHFIRQPLLTISTGSIPWSTLHRKVLLSIFFINSLLIHTVSTNLCHPIWNPRVKSWLLRKQPGGY